MPEISEQDAALLEIAKKITVGPKRKEYLKLAKEVEPELPIPEVDNEQAIQAATAPILAELKELKEKDAARARQDDWDAKRKPLREKHKLNEEEIAKVEKFMGEKKIFDHEVGYDNYKRAQQIASPTTASSYSAVEMPTGEGLLKDPTRWAREEAHKFVTEHQNTR